MNEGNDGESLQSRLCKSVLRHGIPSLAMLLIPNGMLAAKY